MKAFEDTAFSMKPNEISGVVKTEYGFHILQVIEKQTAHLQPFEEVRTQLAEEQKKQMVFDRMQTTADQARAALMKDPGTAEKAAAALGLEFIRADKIGAGEPLPQIGSSPELQDALSSLRKGEVTPVVQIGPTRLAVAVITDIQPSRQAEFAEVEGQIRQRLEGDKLRQLVVQRAKDLIEKTRSLNGDLAKAAQSMGLAAKTPPEFARDGAVEGLGSAGYVIEAFRAPAGTVLGPAAYNDQQVVYKLVSRNAADESELAATRDSLVEQLRSVKGRSRLELFEDNLKQRLVQEGKVKIHQDVINRMVASFTGS